MIEYSRKIFTRFARWVRSNPRFFSSVIGAAFAIGLIFTYAMLSGTKCTSTSQDISIQGWGNAYFGMTDDELERAFSSMSRVVARMEFFNGLYVTRVIPHYDAFGYPFVVKFQNSNKTGRLERVLLTYGADGNETQQLDASVPEEYNRILQGLTQAYGRPDVCLAESQVLGAIMNRIEHIFSALDEFSIIVGRPGFPHRYTSQWTLQNAIIDLNITVQFGRLSHGNRISLRYRHLDSSTGEDAK